MTVPNGLPDGWSTTVLRIGAGVVTLAASGTLQSTGTTLDTQFTAATIIHRGSNVHAALGALGTAGTTIGTINGTTKNVNGAAISGTRSEERRVGEETS